MVEHRARMVATGGTDTHRPMPETFRIAQNRVYAQDNTQEEILAAVTRGHSYVTCGPVLRFDAVASDGTQTGMGDIASPGSLAIRCGWDDLGDPSEPLEAILISQSKKVKRWDCAARNDVSIEIAAEAGQWFVLELRNRDGELYALSNPIFVGQNAHDWK